VPEQKGWLVGLVVLVKWSSLKLAHNLVMHIEKNICEYIIGMLLQIARKTKDTIS
jgi:hypothetical protein